MSYFATLLQRSGVSVGHRDAVAPGSASSAPHVPMAASPPWLGADIEPPAIREIHAERVLPARDVDIERTGLRDTPARAHEAIRDTDESIRPRSSLRARVDPSASPSASAASRDASFASDDRVDPGSPFAPDTSSAPDDFFAAQSRTVADASIAPSELDSSIAIEPPRSSLETRGTAMARALAEVRKWTSQTPLSSEASLVDDYSRAATELPTGIRSIEPRPVAARDSNVAELHVTIGSIEVVVEDASPAPQPAARAPKSQPAASSSSSSRRLARHHLRG